MANFDNIIQEINTNLPDNNTQAITAKKLRDTLTDLTGAIETQQDDFEGVIQDNQNTFETRVNNELNNLGGKLISQDAVNYDYNGFLAASTEVDFYITTSDYLFSSDGSYHTGRYLSVYPGQQLTITAKTGTNQRTFFVYLREIPETINNGDPAPIVEGTSGETIAPNTTKTVIVPSGAKYIWFNRWEGSTTSHLPDAITIYSPSFLTTFNIVNNANSDSSTDVLSANQGKIINDKIEDFLGTLQHPEEININGGELIIGTYTQVEGANEWIWHSSTTSQRTRLFPVRENSTVVVTKTGQYQGTIRLLYDKPVDGEVAPLVVNTFVSANTGDTLHLGLFSVNYPNSADINARSTTRTFIIPEGVKYLTVLAGSSNLYLPDSIKVTYPVSDINIPTTEESETFTKNWVSEQNRYSIVGFSKLPSEIELDENGWQKPQTIQEWNAIQLANRMRFLQWTPKSTIDGPWGAGAPRTYTGGVLQTHGVPYSSNMQDFKFVGLTVSPYTFLTSINNPYSLMYTEYTYTGHSRSAWGRKWNNENGYTYYGAVCCVLTAVTTGSKTYWRNGLWPRLAKLGIFTQVAPTGEFDADHIRIGDVYDSQTDSFMVYGIKRNSAGEITHIRIVEQTRGDNTDAARFYIHTLNNFKTRIATFAHYRFNEFYNIKYNQLPTDPTNIVLTQTNGSDTALSTATQAETTYNNDICTFAGDEAEFKQDDLVVLNYNLTNDSNFSYIGIKLYRNNTLIGTYPFSSIIQSELPEGQRNHALNLGTELLPGIYKAVCYDNNEVESDATNFEILGRDIVSISTEGNEITIQTPNEYTYAALVTKNEATATTEVSYNTIVFTAPTYWELVDRTIKFNKPQGYSYDDLYVVVTVRGTYGDVRIYKKITE